MIERNFFDVFGADSDFGDGAATLGRVEGARENDAGIMDGVIGGERLQTAPSDRQSRESTGECDRFRRRRR